MFSFAARRIAIAIPTLLLIVTAAFFMMRLAPGGPFDLERALPPDIERNLLAAYDMDKSLWQQYLSYVGNLLRGDLGPSFTVRDFTVIELISDGFRASLQLGAIAMLMAAVLGVAAGTLAALRQNGWLDHIVMGIAMTGIAIPNFVMAPLLSLVFGVYLAWLPVAGWGAGAWTHKLLPIVALALPQVAYIARLTRAAMLEVLRTDYVRTARAKGLFERRVIGLHALKVAVLPAVTYLGPAAAGIVTGSVVVETIFDIPGVGRYFIEGALNRDYTLVMGVVVFYSTLIMVLNLAVDIAYAWLDPRVRGR